MRLCRMLFAVGLIVAGYLLLSEPAKAQSVKGAFAPTRFTVVDAGTPGKPDVVLIPGLSSSRAVWDAEAKKLAPNFRLHLVQINGFAGQPAGPNAAGDAILPAIVEELHAYIVANKMHPSVVGHSLGGLLTLMLAKAHPEDVAKMVIVDSLPFYGMMFGPVTVEMVKPQAATMRDQLQAQTPEQRKAGAEKTADQLVLDAQGRKLVAKNSEESDARVFGEAMYEDLQTDLRSDVPNIKTPTLMLYPYEPTMYGPDPARVDALYQGAYKAMPNAKVVRVDGSRHFIQLDQPGKFDELVEAFLKG